MFDKTAYWVRRLNVVTVGEGKKKHDIAKPLRGQGESFDPLVRIHAYAPSIKPVGKRAIRKNSKRARKAAMND